jgi:hypothetical protein
MGLFNLYKPKEYKYRYIYYDPKKEAQKEREQQLSNQEKVANDGEYRPTIRRGTFREMADKNKNARREQAQKSNVRLIMILIILLAIAYFLLK